MPSSMPARMRRRLRRGQLVVELPLQPPVKIDGVGVLGGELGDRRACRVREFLGPAVPVRSVPLCQRTPDREVVEAAPLAFAVRLVCQLAACGSLDPVHALQHVALGLPRRVPVDQFRTAARCPASCTRALRMRPR